MTYQASWGFSSFAGDDLCVKEEISCSNFLIRERQTSLNSFLMPFKISAQMLNSFDGNWSDWMVSSDFEDISNQQIARLFRKETKQAIYTSYTLPMISVSTCNSVKLKKTAQALHFEISEADLAEACHDGDGNHLKNSVVFAVLDYLLSGEYSCFSTEEQGSGVVCRTFKDNLFQVVVLKTCTVSSSTGEGLLSFETYCYKCIPFTLPAQLRQKCLSQPQWVDWFDTEGETGSDSTGFATDIEGHASAKQSFKGTVAVFLPTNESVKLLRLCAFPLPITPAQAVAPKPSLFLTPLDVLNRSKGYSAFLPNNYAAFRDYWELAYGIVLSAPVMKDNAASVEPNDVGSAGGRKSTTANRRGGNKGEVKRMGAKDPAEKKKSTIAAHGEDIVHGESPQSEQVVWLAHIETSLGDRIVPLQALCRGAAELPARTKLHSADMATSLFESLQSASFLSEVRPPVLESECHSNDNSGSNMSGFKGSGVVVAVDNDGNDTMVASKDGVRVSTGSKTFQFATARSVAATVTTNATTAGGIGTIATKKDNVMKQSTTKSTTLSSGAGSGIKVAPVIGNISSDRSCDRNNTSSSSVPNSVETVRKKKFLLPPTHKSLPIGNKISNTATAATVTVPTTTSTTALPKVSASAVWKRPHDSLPTATDASVSSGNTNSIHKKVRVGVEGVGHLTAPADTIAGTASLPKPSAVGASSVSVDGTGTTASLLVSASKTGRKQLSSLAQSIAAVAEQESSSDSDSSMCFSNSDEEEKAEKVVERVPAHSTVVLKSTTNAVAVKNSSSSDTATAPSALLQQSRTEPAPAVSNKKILLTAAQQKQPKLKAKPTPNKTTVSGSRSGDRKGEMSEESSVCFSSSEDEASHSRSVQTTIKTAAAQMAASVETNRAAAKQQPRQQQRLSSAFMGASSGNHSDIDDSLFFSEHCDTYQTADTSTVTVTTTGTVTSAQREVEGSAKVASASGSCNKKKDGSKRSNQQQQQKVVSKRTMNKVVEK